MNCPVCKSPIGNNYTVLFEGAVVKHNKCNSRIENYVQIEYDADYWYLSAK